MSIQPIESPDTVLHRRAQSQYGLISRRQALGAGLTAEAIRHRVRTGRFEVVARNVYRLAGTPNSWEQRLLAALLSIGDDAAVSYRSAATLLGLLPREDIIELSVPNRRKIANSLDWIIHRVMAIPPQDVVHIGPYRVIEPHRTIIDIAGVVDCKALDKAIDTGHQKKIIRIKRLDYLLRTIERRGRPGIGTLAQLVAERYHGGRIMDSLLERKFLALVKKWRFPLPVAQHPMRLANGKTAYIDFAYPERKLAIECDGFDPHGNRQSFEDDRERDRYLAVEKWTPIRVTWADVTVKQDALRETLRLLLFD